MRLTLDNLSGEHEGLGMRLTLDNLSGEHEGLGMRLTLDNLSKACPSIQYTFPMVYVHKKSDIGTLYRVPN